MNKKILASLLIFFYIFIPKINSAEFDVKARTAILQDYLSGKILFEKNADLRIFPASMTKIMTSIIAFDLIKKEQLSLDEKFFISENAWRLSQAGYSSMFIMVGDQITVENLLKGIIISSGNDACVALAEGIAGTEEEFAIMMTSKAKEIGMTNTNFANSSGINHPNNLSTARDILIMSNYLIKNYPVYYEYFKEKEFTWNRTGGDPITQGNRNPLLYKNIGADGIKTGFLSVEKYSLAASVKTNERRVTVVGSGFKTKNSRSRESMKILNWGLKKFDTVKIIKKDEIFTDLDVWLGNKKKVQVVSKENYFLTIPKRKKKTIKAILEYNGPLEAPIQKGEKVATLSVYVSDILKNEIDILAAEDVEKSNIFSRVFTSLNYLVWGDV